MARPSAHSNEYVVCAVIQPDPTKVPTGYRLPNPPPEIDDDFGNPIKLPAEITLPAVPDGQRDVITTLDVSGNDGTYTTRDRVGFSHRYHMAVEWRTTVTLTAA